MSHLPPPPPTARDAAARRRRIAELRALIAAGAYRVPAEDVADAMLRDLRRAGRPR